LSPSTETTSLIRSDFRYTEIVISVYLKSDLIREVVSVEGDKLVYYLSVSEIGPDKRSGICPPQQRPLLLSGQISDTLR
jgi:hypothetical protein